jgi:arabinogalactan endo-1,4-beta-galactosidase
VRAHLEQSDLDWLQQLDVLKTIRRAKAAGLQVLLDFHYSDDWADGEKQRAPAAWEKLSTDDQAKALYDFTREILGKLAAEKLMPELVQVGNEPTRSSWEA